jgi:hypothetical protein
VECGLCGGIEEPIESALLEPSAEPAVARPEEPVERQCKSDVRHIVRIDPAAQCVSGTQMRGWDQIFLVQVQLADDLVESLDELMLVQVRIFQDPFFVPEQFRDRELADVKLAIGFEEDNPRSANRS